MVWHARGRSKTLLSIDHEYVLVYVRQRDSLVSNIEAGNDVANWYGEPVERKYTNPDNDPRGLWRDAQHTVTQKKAHYTYSINRYTGEIRDDVLMIVIGMVIIPGCMLLLLCGNCSLIIDYFL